MGQKAVRAYFCAYDEKISVSISGMGWILLHAPMSRGPLVITAYPLLTTKIALGVHRQCCNLIFGGGVQVMVSWRSSVTRWHWRDLSKSRIRAAQCYNCP